MFRENRSSISHWEPNMGIKKDRIFVAWIALALIGSGCTGPTISAPTSTTDNATAAPATVASILAVPSTPTTAPKPTATSIPLPTITLKPGENYFSLDGKQSFIFSRNITGAYDPEFSDFEKFLEYARAAGDRVVRLQIDNLGLGFRNDGTVDETWAQKWDRIFDLAVEKRLDIIPEFGVWLWWNTDGLWKDNPLNTLNGGPAKTSGELFKKNSDTQKLWLGFVKKLTERWQSRKNIVAWEMFSEINLAMGSTYGNALDFVEPASAVIRGADPQKRPVTVSFADVVSVWPNVNQSKAVDFLEVHPYPVDGKLDRYIVNMVGQRIRDLHRPVLIGESGLTGISPDPFTHQPNAHYGVEHAIWAAIVSGAMNGRALWDQDSYAIYWSGVSDSDKQKFITEYSKTEVPAVNFVKDVDFAGFLPLAVTLPAGTKIWGAAVGNGKTVLGWFRDAFCEPPDWKLQPMLSKQSVTVTVPGTAANWRVDFYDTATGTKLINSITVKRNGGTITFSLPDFKDDIAFKMYAQ
jgi:hypothetical protein